MCSDVSLLLQKRDGIFEGRLVLKTFALSHLKAIRAIYAAPDNWKTHNFPASALALSACSVCPNLKIQSRLDSAFILS